MGGIGSGGRRVGSGQKGKRALVVRHPSAPASPSSTDAFDPPKTLRGKARAVWAELAPLAFEARTLSRATELSFVVLCRNVALERKMAAARRGAGNANHRGMIQRIDAELAHFCLAPFGKPLSEAKPAAAPISKWAGLLR